jgi:hypothetical protein
VNDIRCATGKPYGIEEGGNEGGRGAVLEGKDKDGFREAVHDSQSFGLASDGLTLALEVHGVAGAGFVGGVAGEESVGETSLTLFVFAFSAVLEPATNVGAHGWPKVVPGERGMHLGVGEVVKVGVVLASERFAEGERNHDARGEVGIAEDVETVTGGEGIGVDGGKAVGVGELGGFPIL